MFTRITTCVFCVFATFHYKRTNDFGIYDRIDDDIPLERNRIPEVGEETIARALDDKRVVRRLR